MVTALYRSAPAWTRFHVGVRWRLFPFPALLPYAPTTGLAVDLGCGHGLLPFFLASERPALRLLASDPDGDKIGLAQEVARQNRIHNVQFVTALAQDTEYPACDWISLIDVLYLVPYEVQEALLRRAVARLRPGGRLMIKEMSERPRWKAAWGQAQELVAVRVLHLSQGHSFYFRSEADWLALLSGLGLRTSVLPLDAGYLHPHVLFIGENAS